MYKKKDLMSILDIVNDYPKAATLQLRDSLKDMIEHPRKNPKFSKSEKDVLRLLYYKIIYSDNTNRDRLLLSRSCRSAGSKTNIMRSGSIRKKISGKRFLSPRKRSKMEFMVFV